MYCHPVLSHWLCEVVIFEPQEPQEVLLVITDCETVKHLLHIHRDCNGFPAEANKDSKKSIIRVWSLQEDVVEGDTFVLGPGIKHHRNLVWLLGVVDAKCW